MKSLFSRKKFWISKDGWRGYEQPVYAIVGASDTGDWPDSPAPTRYVTEEIIKFRKILKDNNILTRVMFTRSSNVFMIKHWIIVPVNQFELGKQIARTLFNEVSNSYHHIHLAN